MSGLKVGDRLSWPIPWRDADETTVQVTAVANGHVLVCTVLEPHTCANWMGGCELGGATARAPESWLPEPAAEESPPSWGVGDVVRDSCGAAFQRTSEGWRQIGGQVWQDASPHPPLTRLVPARLSEEATADAVRHATVAARLLPPDFGSGPDGWKLWVTFGARSALDALYPEKP